VCLLPDFPAAGTFRNTGSYKKIFMHTYFRAIGFSEPMKSLDRINLLDDILNKPTYRAYTSMQQDSEEMLTELRMDLGDGYGISVLGIYDEEDEFECMDMFPYMANGRISTLEEISIEPRIDGCSFAGVVDDLKLGMTLIFRLRNVVDYVKAAEMYRHEKPMTSAALSALSIEGTILMPIMKTEQDLQIQESNYQARNALMDKARSGNEDAMRDLTMKDMDAYSLLIGKAQTEDMYTLVDNYFMPTGVECDLYSILGEIVSCRLTQNPYTLEKIYVMNLDCNHMHFTLCINQMDLYGEPQVGRRFRGIVWMQGEIHFN